MSNTVGQFTIHIDQVEGYRFRTRFDKDRYADLITDEPSPLSQDTAPNAARKCKRCMGKKVSSQEMQALHGEES